MLEYVIIALVIAIIVIAIIYILSIWVYKRAPSNMGFIRTGSLGTKVCLGQGAIVLPVFHEITWVSLETIKLIVSRSRDQAILTSDKIRVDITAELYTHVGHTVENLLTASRTLGDKTFDSEQVRNLLEAKVVSALRSYAATKTLSELHENRDAFAQAMKAGVLESFKTNGLILEEVTIVTMEQTGKEYFKADNVFDAEGLKIITDITSSARRVVHDTEKRTAVAIRQKDLDTQLELLEIERQEAFARANQDKAVSNEQAQQVREKQVFVLNQRMAVEEQEIGNDVALERQRTGREVALTEEALKREAIEIQKSLALEQERKEKEIQLIQKEKERELVEIQRATAVAAEEQTARNARHEATEGSTLAMRQRKLETTLATLDMDRDEAVAEAQQEQEVANEKARILGEKQRYVLDRRWEVQQEELSKEEALRRAEVRRTLAVELEEREREIALIAKEQERERVDIRRFLARELEERDREIVLVEKARELEQTEAERLKTTAERERAEHEMESVRPVADAERAKEIERIEAEKLADTQRIEEERKAEINRMHMVTQAEARRQAAELEAEATRVRAAATSEAQKISAEGIEREAGAVGRADMEVEALRVANSQRQLEAEATGMEAKAAALKKYNEAATFLELSKLYIEAERDIHIDQAKAMGNALQNAQIRMYGGGDGTMDTVRGMFTSGFGIGEVLEGVAQSMPEGLRRRFAANGVRGIFGRPHDGGSVQQAYEQLDVLVSQLMGGRDEQEVPLAQAVATLTEAAGEDEAMIRAVGLLKDLGERDDLRGVPFRTVWSLLRAVARTAD